MNSYRRLIGKLAVGLIFVAAALVFPLHTAGANEAEEDSFTQFLAQGFEREELTGPWFFRLDPEGKGLEGDWQDGVEKEEWQEIEVPARWHETHVGREHGYGWYKTRFFVPEELADAEHELYFEAVDEQAWVYVNGEHVGEHTEESTGQDVGVLWSTPFSIRISPRYLRAGEENLLVVRCHASVGAAGIWRPVYLQRSPDVGQIMEKLSDLHEDEAIGMLETALEKGSWVVRRLAAEMLDEMGTETDVEILEEATGWPMWQYDPSRTGDTPFPPDEELHLQWVRELPEPARACSTF